MPAVLTITTVDDGTRLVLTGELDTHTAPDLVERLASVPDGTVLGVDLAGTTFMSSAGLSALLDARRRLVAGGGELRVESPSPAVARLLELSGAADLLGPGPA
jgi:anti-anti-sigma factor